MKEGFVILKFSAQRVSESAARNRWNQHSAARGEVGSVGGEARVAREGGGGGGGRLRSEKMVEMEVEVEEMRDSRERDWWGRRLRSWRRRKEWAEEMAEMS